MARRIPEGGEEKRIWRSRPRGQSAAMILAIAGVGRHKDRGTVSATYTVLCWRVEASSGLSTSFREPTDRNEDATGNEAKGKKDRSKTGRIAAMHMRRWRGRRTMCVEADRQDGQRTIPEQHQRRSTVHAAEAFLFPSPSAAKLLGSASGGSRFEQHQLQFAW